MKDMEIWIGILLLSVCGVSVALAAYSLQEGMGRRIRQTFLAICVSLAVWSFGQAVAAGAREKTAALLGLRTANLGWDLTACMILTFLMVLTGSCRLLRKKWVWALAYLPSAFHVLAFSALPFWGMNAEDMRRGALGWAGVLSSHNAWIWGYFFQPLAFQAMGLWLLLRWLRHAGNRAARKQARILIAAFLVTAVLSVVSELVPAFTGARVPRISAALMLIPIFTLIYLFRRFHFLRTEEDSDELILSEASRTRIYFWGGILSAAGASLIFFLPLVCLPRSVSVSMLPVSAPLLVIAACLLVVGRIPMEDRLRELTVALCFSLAISTASLWSAREGNLTVWAFAFALMLVSLLFNCLIVLSAAAVSTFVTQLFLWSYQPVAFMEVSIFVYAMRLLILAVMALISLYVHRVYVRRLKENANHMVKHALAAETSQSFISANEENLDEKFGAALERCGRFIRCDRAYLVLLGEDGTSFSSAREWLADGVSSGIREFEASLSEISPMMQRQMEESGAVILRDAALLPPMAGKAKRELLRQGIRALVTIPLKNKNANIGFLGFNAGAPIRKWNLDDPSFLQVIAGIMTEAALKVEAEKKIHFIAYHDQLTGLPNRLLFSDRLRQAIPQADRTERMLAVVFIDLDSFKTVNDTMGHEAGDRLLTAVAETLVHAVRRYDTVSRFGGDEFILLLNQIAGAEDLLRILNKLSDALCRSFRINGQKIFVTASIGAALYPQDGTDAETLIKNADMAMYHAKGNGKNRYALCSQNMKGEILDKMRLTNFLYRALERKQLLLYYQPQIDTRSRAIVGCEALLRWNLPGRGIIPPAVFIPLAEQTGLIQPIGAWVLKTACRQNRKWHELGFTKLRMAVNLSVHQLKNPKFIQQVGDILACTGLPAQFLELEITESVAGGNIDTVEKVLDGLKSLGVTISIDDFGTEYSSLSRLKQLPVDRIKIGMQFVQGIETSEKDQAISKVIITLARNLDMKVIAEGVETKPQLDFLSQRMCDEVQGFYCYRPMPAEQMEAVLLENRSP